MSNGTLRVLALLIAVSQQPPPSLIVIEEPAVTIHSDALDALRIAGPSMQVVMTPHSPDLLVAQWIADQHIRIASWAAGISQIRPVSSAVRETLRERLMGAGALLRANALWPDKDSPVGTLFLKPPWARSSWHFLMFQLSDMTFGRRTRASADTASQGPSRRHGGPPPTRGRLRVDRGLRGVRAWRVRTLRSGSALWSLRPCRDVNARRTRGAGRRASSGGNASWKEA